MGGVFSVGCELMKPAARPQQNGQKAKRRQVMVGGRRVLTVDVHSHCSVDIEDLIKDHTVGGSGTTGPLGPFRATILKPENVDARLRHMDEHGTDIQAVSPVPSYNYWADRDLASRMVQRQNEQIAAM